ncbi:MAG: hypothetical protein QQN41_09880 [Nitrosopumilus sp.]
MSGLFPCDWVQPTPNPKGPFRFNPKGPLNFLNRKEGAQDKPTNDSNSSKEEPSKEEPSKEPLKFDGGSVIQGEPTPKESALVDESQILLKMDHVNKILDQNIKMIENLPNEESTVTKEQLIKLMHNFSNYSHELEICFKNIISCRGSHNVDQNPFISLKSIDITKAKIILVQIPEKLYLKEGYKSLDKLMKAMKTHGITIVAVPETLNLVDITEKDLEELDLVKISEMEE